MKNSSEPSGSDPVPQEIEASLLELEFPVDPDFVSELPRVEFQAMVRRIEESLASRNSRPGEGQRRWENRIQVEFVL